MSKSYGNSIQLADTEEEIRQKVGAMFTDPTRVRRTDPGHPESCNLFDFHKLVSPPELQEKVARECRLAQIGCVDDKKLLADRLVEYFAPIRERREALIADRDTLLDIVAEGSRKAQERAQETLDEVRASMGLDYRKLVAEVTG